MPRVELDVESEVPPGQVIAALTDFTDRRPDIWPGLKHEEYEVYRVGETSAEVREGSSKRIWARERYDWSTPGVVRWEVVESGFCKPGSFVEVRVATNDGGSRIHVTWQRHATNLGYGLMLGIIKLTGGAPVRSSLRKGLDRIRAQA
jgi:hypothetical protein